MVNKLTNMNTVILLSVFLLTLLSVIVWGIPRGVSFEIEGMNLLSYVSEQKVNGASFGWVYIRNLFGWLNFGILEYRWAAFLLIIMTFLSFSILSWRWVAWYTNISLQARSQFYLYTLINIMAGLGVFSTGIVAVGYNELNVFFTLLLVGFFLLYMSPCCKLKGISLLFVGFFSVGVFFTKVSSFVVLMSLVIFIVLYVRKSLKGVALILLGAFFHFFLFSLLYGDYTQLLNDFVSGFSYAHQSSHGFKQIIYNQYDGFIKSVLSVIFYIAPLMVITTGLSVLFSKCEKHNNWYYFFLIASVALSLSWVYLVLGVSNYPPSYTNGEIQFAWVILIVLFLNGDKVWGKVSKIENIGFWFFVILVGAVLYMLIESIYGSMLKYVYMLIMLVVLFYVFNILLKYKGTNKGANNESNFVLLVLFILPVAIVAGSRILFFSTSIVFFWLTLLIIFLLKWRGETIIISSVRNNITNAIFIILSAFLCFQVTYSYVVEATAYPTTLVRQNIDIDGIDSLSGMKADLKTKYFYEELYKVVHDNVNSSKPINFLTSQGIMMPVYIVGAVIPNNLSFLVPEEKECGELKKIAIENKRYPNIFSIQGGKDMEDCLNIIGQKIEEDYINISQLEWPYKKKSEVSSDTLLDVFIHKENLRVSLNSTISND